MIEIDEVVAVEAHQVVVELGASVEAGDPTRVAGLSNHAHAGEVLERALDRRAGDAGETSLDGVADLISRRVVFQVEDRFEDGPPLHRAALAAFSAQAMKLVDSSLFFQLVQAAALRISPSLWFGAR
jgi:hypothetical protein